MKFVKNEGLMKMDLIEIFNNELINVPVNLVLGETCLDFNESVIFLN
jgi:hypothetical protein